MPEQSSISALQAIVRDSFITEVNALKPGNVSRYADGHGMTCNDFLLSADLVTPILCDRKLSMGQRILESVKITKLKSGKNTNLGMLLLFAPLIITAEQTIDRSVAATQHKLQDILSTVNMSDSRLIFQAIKEANPGGLGQSSRFDVNLMPECSLWEAMEEARKRDSIARQYVTGFSDIFSTGLEVIKEFTGRWNSVKWATVACYLKFLAGIPDSHVIRKSGRQVADQTRIKAIAYAEEFIKNDNPESAQSALLEFDRELKNLNINPGTSADLVAASILVYKLVDT